VQLCVAFGRSQIIVTRIVVLTGVSAVPLVVLVGTLVVLYSLTFLEYTCITPHLQECLLNHFLLSTNMHIGFLVGEGK